MVVVLVHADSLTDATFHSAGPPGLGLDVAGGHEPFHPFHSATYHGELAAAGHDAAASQSLGDPMDLDLDFDAALWAGDMDPSGHLETDMNINYAPIAMTAPADFLFAEDEGMLPTGPYNGQLPVLSSHSISISSVPQIQPVQPSPTHTMFSVARSEAGSDDVKLFDGGAQDENGIARQRLRRQLSLLSKGWAGDEIRFKNCDPSKAVVLHAFAMELGLGYNHDVRSREVSMARLGPAQIASAPQISPRRVSSSLPRSSTELDSTLCLPGLPAVPEFRTLEIASDPTPGTGPQQPQAILTDVVMKDVKDQHLVRRPSRSERITDSISKHVSTLKTSIAKGGRRGPLTENGRRDMKALEAAGGACWRCKVLRRKVRLLYLGKCFLRVLS